MPKAKASAKARRGPAPHGGSAPRPRRARGSRGGAPAAAAAPGTGAGAAGGRGRSRRSKAAKAAKAKKSAFTSVTQDRRTGRWRADIQHDKRQVYVGTFGSEEAAARARDRVAIHLGRKTGLNFPAADYKAEAEQLRRMDRQALLTQLRPDVEGTSQYRGVSFNKSKGKWQTRIWDETGKLLHLGSFQQEQ